MYSINRLLSITIGNNRSYFDVQYVNIAMLVWGCVFCLIAGVGMILSKNFDRRKRLWMILLQFATAVLLFPDLAFASPAATSLPSCHMMSYATANPVDGPSESFESALSLLFLQDPSCSEAADLIPESVFLLQLPFHTLSEIAVHPAGRLIPYIPILEIFPSDSIFS